MKQLLTLRSEDVGATPNPDTVFRERRAARAVMLNEQDGVYLVHMKTRGYYKLPGGGVEEKEDSETALHRELLEECGTDGDIVAEVGSIEEFREDQGLHQISECYIVRQKGGHVLPDFTAKGQKENPEIYIASSIDEAIALVEGSVPANDGCRFMQHRDSAFLREAQRLLSI